MSLDPQSFILVRPDGAPSVANGKNRKDLLVLGVAFSIRVEGYHKPSEYTLGTQEMGLAIEKTLLRFPL